MNLEALLDEIFEVLAAADIDLTIPDDEAVGVRSAPPAPYVELPDITYGDAGAGLDRIPDLAIIVVFGQANNPQVFRTALRYASTTGAQSIRAALMAHAWTSCSTLYVRQAEATFETRRGENPACAYTFHLDITGRSS